MVENAAAYCCVCDGFHADCNKEVEGLMADRLIVDVLILESDLGAARAKDLMESILSDGKRRL